MGGRKGIILSHYLQAHTHTSAPVAIADLQPFSVDDHHTPLSLAWAQHEVLPRIVHLTRPAGRHQSSAAL